METDKKAKSKANKLSIVSHLMSKLVDAESRKIAIDKIKEHFEDPNKYFEIDNTIIVGRKPFGPRYDKDNNLIRRSIVGDPKIFNERNLVSAKSVHSQKSANSKSNSSDPVNSGQNNFNSNLKNSKVNNLQIKIKKSKTTIINDNQIQEIYNNAKERIIKTADIVNREIFFNNNIPNSSQQMFYKQENILGLNKKQNNKSEKMSRAISAKIKREDQDLLMNRTDGFRFKKQIFELIDSKKSIYEKYGENSWLLSLRRNKAPTSMRINYINVGSDFAPLWKPLIEYPKKNMAIIQKPNANAQKELKYFLKNEYFKEVLKKNNVNINNMNNLSRLQVEGKDILENEFRQINSLQGKKQLFNGNKSNGKFKNELIKQNYEVISHNESHSSGFRKQN